MEFSVLRRVFCSLLGYNYIEKRRNKPDKFTSRQDSFSQVAVINTKDSNISDISEETYLDEVFNLLREKYKFPVDQSAIYYLFDRDPKSNTDTALIEKYILSLADPYDNEDFKSGQLLLSYPSIESYIISNFREETLMCAAGEFLKYLESEEIAWDIDDFSGASHTVFTKQEADYFAGKGFQVFSMLTLAFLQMWIIELE